MEEQQIPRSDLIKIQEFLSVVSETNEDTEYDPSQEYIVNSIIELVKQHGNTSITEDFDVPYIHPMITIQKWIEELKLIVNDVLREKNL